MLTTELNQKIILPLLETLELSQEDKVTLFNSLNQLFFIKVMPKIFTCLTRDESLKLKNKLDGCKTMEEKLAIVNDFISNSEEVDKILQNYSKETLVPLINRLAANFISIATPQQRTNLLRKLS